MPTTQPTIFEPQILYPEQITAKKPWERQEGESAKWHMRFRNYLTMGPKRSVHAVFEAEKQNKVEKSRGRPGETWYNASKKYQWQKRAEAWDAEQDEQKATIMRDIAMKSPFLSKPFRLYQLNSMADSLSRHLEQGVDIATFLALSKQQQSLMHDIRDELEEWNMHPDASCDAAALTALQEKNVRLREFQEERELDQEAVINRMFAQHELMQQQIQKMKQSR